MWRIWIATWIATLFVGCADRGSRVPESSVQEPRPLELPAEPPRYDIQPGHWELTYADILGQHMRACDAGALASCRMAASMSHEYDELMRELCASGDPYSCRLLTPSQRRREPGDCVRGFDITCPELRRVDPGFGTQLDIDGCQHGVLFDCWHAASDGHHLPSGVRDCHASGGSCDVVARMLFDLGDVEGARYHLEVTCQVFQQCERLYAAYRGEYLPELYPGRLGELREPKEWSAYDPFKDTSNQLRFPRR